MIKCNWLLSLLAILGISFSYFSMASEEVYYPFTRLFTTNDERQALDVERDKLDSIEPNRTSSGSQPAVVIANGLTLPEAPQGLYLSGVIVRADGRKEIWLNGEKVQNGEVIASEFKNFEAQLKLDKKAIKLKVGQKWQDNQVIDIYQQQRP